MAGLGSPIFSGRAMDSDWLDNATVRDMLDEAGSGNPHRLDQYLADSPLRCCDPESKFLVIVREHRSWFVAGDGWYDLNLPPEKGEAGRQFVNLFWCSALAGGWSKLAVPLVDPIHSVAWADGAFVFETRSRVLRAQPLQVSFATGRGMSAKGQTEDQIEANFRSMEDPLPPPSPPPAPRRPVVQDSFLGDLKYDESVDWYEKRIRSGEVEFQLTISPDENACVEIPLGKAREFVRNVKSNLAATAMFAAEMLLTLKNETWLQEDESPLTREQFVGRLRLQSISFKSDGSFEYFFEDGDIFWGHCIVVPVDLAGRFEEPYLAG